MSKKNMQQILEEVQNKRQTTISNELSPAFKEFMHGDMELLKNVIDLTDRYESEAKRLKSLDGNNFTNDSQRPEFMEQ